MNKRTQDTKHGQPPKWEKHLKKEFYTVPENYFSDLPAQIMDSLPVDKPAHQGMRWPMLLKLALPTVAILSIFYYTTVYRGDPAMLHSQNQAVDAMAALDKLDSDELILLLGNELSTWDESYLTLELLDEDISLAELSIEDKDAELMIDEPTDDELQIQVSEEALEAYLLDQSDLEYLIDEI